MLAADEGVTGIGADAATPQVESVLALGKMLDQGLLTPDEFHRLKAEAMDDDTDHADREPLGTADAPDFDEGTEVDALGQLTDPQPDQPVFSDSAQDWLDAATEFRSQKGIVMDARILRHVWQLLKQDSGAAAPALHSDVLARYPMLRPPDRVEVATVASWLRSASRFGLDESQPRAPEPEPVAPLMIPSKPSTSASARRRLAIRWGAVSNELLAAHGVHIDPRVLRYLWELLRTNPHATAPQLVTAVTERYEYLPPIDPVDLASAVSWMRTTPRFGLRP